MLEADCLLRIQYYYEKNSYFYQSPLSTINEAALHSWMKYVEVNI